MDDDEDPGLCPECGAYWVCDCRIAAFTCARDMLTDATDADYAMAVDELVEQEQS